MPKETVSLREQYRRRQETIKQVFDTKEDYENHLMMKYFPEMGFLLREARLSYYDKKGEKLPIGDHNRWDRPFNHSFMALKVADNLSDALGLPFEEKERLCKVASLHDWDKRLEKKPSDFSPEERDVLMEKLTSINPNRALLESTKIEFEERIVNGEEASFIERLMHYIDCICDEDAINAVAKRINAARARNQYALTYKALDEKVKKRYGPDKDIFDATIVMAEETQSMIWKKLQERGCIIASPDEVPVFIKKLIKENYKSE